MPNYAEPTKETHFSLVLRCLSVYLRYMVNILFTRVEIF